MDVSDSFADRPIPSVTEAEIEAFEHEEAEQHAYELRCAERARAEDEWVDAAVRDTPSRPPSSAVASAAAPEDATWEAALAPQGLTLLRRDRVQRGVKTMRKFAPGEVVLRATAAAMTLTNESSTTHCHHCVRPSGELMRCSACGFARYSSAANQRAAWASHKHECAMLKRTRPRVPGPTVRMLIRLLNLIDNDDGHATPRAPETAAAWAAGLGGVRSLHAHLESLPPSRASELQNQAAMLCGLQAEVYPSRAAPSVDLATSLLGVLSCNAHTICDDELQPIGLGLYPLAALTNHDCEPNCVQTFEAGALVLRAIRPISCHEEVTIAYVDVLAASPATRRAALAGGYHFQCACARCMREAPHEARLHSLATRLTRAREATLAAIDGQRWDEALEASARCCQLCDDLLLPPDGSITTNVTAFAAGGSGEPASPLPSASLAALPSVSIERVRHAKLLAHANRLSEAADEWARALVALRCSHGEGADLVRSVGDDLAGAQADRVASAVTRTM